MYPALVIRHLPIIGLALSIWGCASSQFPTLTVYETPSLYVQLAIDRMFGTEHSHPANLTAEQIAHILNGIVIEEPLAKLPFIDDTSLPRRHPAFTEKETAVLAPLLLVALKRATREEIVTFYESNPPTGIRRDVTSGGLFIHDDELHVVLANYRSPTHYMADSGVADTTDDRLVPMRPIAPQRGVLAFEPKSALRHSEDSLFSKLFHRDRRELIILLSKLPAVSFQKDTAQ